MSDTNVTLRDIDGSAVEYDERNQTVTYKGKQFSYTEHDASDYAQRDLTQANVHVAAALTNFAIDYGSNSDEAIADQAAPVVLVDKASDTYHTYSANNKYRRVSAALSGEDAGIPEVGAQKGTSTYTTVPYGLSSFIAQGVEANADAGVNPRMRAMSRILNGMTIEREYRAAAALMNATTFTAGTTALTSSNFWDGGASSDPLKDIQTAEEYALAPINRMILSKKGWNRFLTNEQVSKFGIYVGQAVDLSPQATLSRLGYPNIVPLIGYMKGEAAAQGTTTKDYVWDDDCLFAHVPQGNSLEDVPTARTFRWLKDGMARESGGYRIREWFEPSRGQDGGTKIAVVTNEVIVVTAADTGYLFTNIY